MASRPRPALLEDAGARKVVPLAVAGPFHSPLMEPARAAFEQILVGADFADARIPVLQNTDPTPETDGERIRERLIAQITSPVRWTETMAALVGRRPDHAHRSRSRLGPDRAGQAR